MAIAATVSIAAIVCILAFVIIGNYSRLKHRYEQKNTSVVSSVSLVEEETFTPVSKEVTYTVSDLDFYNMYDSLEDEEDSLEETVSVDTTDTVAEENDPSKDRKHISLINQDGTVEWVNISPNIPKNDYDVTNLLLSGQKYKYFEDNQCVSKFGVDISKEQDYIDFNKVKKAGVDFVMLRVGTRGYQSGQINMDEYFAQNLKRATDAGLDIGVYFVSNAITEDEAKEEANYVIGLLGDYKLTYPIAFDMEYVKGDVSRIELVSKTDKTMIARAFLNTIKNAGYKPCVYGSKEWLLKEVDLVKLVGDYDFWLSDYEVDFPEYPYKYSMWQYDRYGSIDGISGNVSLNISFSDYALK